MDATSTFKNALDCLENTLLTPVVPGELQGWLADLQESAEATKALLRRQIESVHKPDLDQMARRDPELLSHVEQLRREDSDAPARLQALLERITQLKGSAGQCEPDEAALKSRLDSLVEDALAWVIHAKGQERALETWFSQSFNRDLGVGD